MCSHAIANAHVGHCVLKSNNPIGQMLAEGLELVFCLPTTAAD